MTRPAPKIAIVGAGIGGLATAALLLRRGFDVTVHEQATRFARVGAGIQQSPNVMKVHRGLGIEDRLRATAFAPRTSLNRDGVTGETTNEFPLGKEVEERYGAPFLAMHRGDLHAALADLVPAQHIDLGRKLKAIDQDGTHVTLTFEDGSRTITDAVIGADGVHSLIRDYVVGPESPTFTGRVAYRTTFPTTLLRSIDIGMSRTKWWGPDRHIVIYYTTANCDEVYFVTSTPEKADWITKESWSTKGDLDELQNGFKAFHRDVRAVLAAAPERLAAIGQGNRQCRTDLGIGRNIDCHRACAKVDADQFDFARRAARDAERKHAGDDGDRPDGETVAVAGSAAEFLVPDADGIIAILRNLHGQQ